MMNRSAGRRVSALAAVVVVGLAIVGSSSPAVAVPPFPAGANAVVLIGGTPLRSATCPPGGAPSQGNTTLGTVTVTNASASCTLQSAAATGGQTTINGTVLPSFSSTCQNTTGVSNGSVNVPAGTSINGGPPVMGITGVNVPATVTFANGDTAVLNEVVTTPTSVQRTAIRMTSGPASGTIIGRVFCGAPYPLAVEVGSPGEAVSDVAGQLTSGGGSSNTGTMLAIGLAVVLVAAQVAFVVTLLRRRAASH